ncbi:MAG: TetR/AcrR family transcriptional regulator [Pseudomonadota bacterium]
MKTRDALLDSAENLCRTRGYEGFSYADLAEDVGIRKASIHHHFPAKTDLADALIQRYGNIFFRNLDAIAARHDRAGDRLRAYVQCYRDSLAGGKMLCLCVSFGSAPDSLTALVRDEIASFQKESMAWLKNLFVLGREDCSIDRIDDPVREAAACLAQMEGAQLLARAARDVSLFDRSVAALLVRIR